MRRKVIAGNWKMNMLPGETINFIEQIAPMVKKSENEIILCVPFTDIFYAWHSLEGSNIKLGAQNMHWEESGAYTGEISGQMLKSVGVEYVIIGHSERRAYFAETDETVNKKIKAVFANDLKPILCVGESLDQREAGKTEEIITNQTEKALEGLTNEQIKNTIIAYEPIWAIGTGRVATTQQAQEVCCSIRGIIRDIYGTQIADAIRILYGGSVNAGNALQLFSEPDIDGGLVGGASLKPEFSKIVNYQ